jgi:hypothetical protein
MMAFREASVSLVRTVAVYLTRFPGHSRADTKSRLSSEWIALNSLTAIAPSRQLLALCHEALSREQCRIA